MYLVPASCLLALMSTIIIMPFDCLKTQKQVFREHGSSSENYGQIISQIQRETGIKGFFVGWRIRFAMYLVHALITVDLIEKLEGL